MRCPYCSVEFKNKSRLTQHARNVHEIDNIQLYVDTNCDGVWPLCACGCGKRLLHPERINYGKYLKGHWIRANCQSKRPEVKQKLREQLIKTRAKHRDGAFSSERLASYARRYKINEDYFAAIDSEEKAYFLGLLVADGNVASKGSAIRISLNAEDAYILEAMRTSMNSEHPIKLITTAKHPNSIMHKFCFSSIRLKQQLAKLSVVPNKSHRDENPSDLPHDLIRHYIRGLFDGDGCVYRTKDNRLVINMLATPKLCQYIVDYLNSENIKAYSYVVKQCSTIKQIYIGERESIERFYRLLYANSTVYMKRKYDKFELIRVVI